MTIRCTARLLKLLGASAARCAEIVPTEDDWYANVLWIDRRKCLLLTHSGTLFPIFVADVRKGELVGLGTYVTGVIADALAREGLPAATLGHVDPADIHVARTANRSLLGHMTDMAFTCEHEVGMAGGLAHADIAAINQRLRRGLHNRGGYVVPLELARQRAGLDPS